MFYASRTMAHGHDTQTEVIGTSGMLSVGHNPRLNRVEIADASGVRNDCMPTFFERFEEAFLHEARAFVEALRGGAPTGLDARGRPRGDADRHCAARRRSKAGNRWSFRRCGRIQVSEYPGKPKAYPMQVPMQVHKEVDARGLNCPLPILRAKKALADMESGQILKVLATDPGSQRDFAAFAKQTGNEIVESTAQDKTFVFLMRRR